MSPLYPFKHWFVPLLLLISFTTYAQRDLPNPASSIEDIPAGNLVIPMDTNHQSIVPAGAPPFNLHAYGLVYTLLQNGIPVKWAIRTPKERDDIDFSGTAERIYPSTTAAAPMDFRGGPFIVPDTVLPCGTNTREIIELFANDVAVYQLTENTTADIGYTLVHRPKIAVFDNGGNENLHTKILDGVGINDYDVMDANDIAALKNCYTFVSEPHADDNQVSQDMVDGIREYVMNGGNFLAQCHAVSAYENKGFFHTTNGITTVNTEISHLYPNADLTYSQIHGPLEENEGGSVGNWTLAENSEWRNYAYRSVPHLNEDTVVAMGAKLTDPGTPGGNVFYLGGHDYGRDGNPNNPLVLTTLPRLNALRMYLNAALVASGNPNMAWADAGGPTAEIGCSDSVELGCDPTGPPNATFEWTPSTGLSCTDCPHPMASPSENTTYYVEVTHGCSVTDSIEVLVDASPEALFDFTTVCEGNATTFTNSSTGTDLSIWDFGDPASGEDNNTSTLENPSHTFSTHGDFEVTLIAGTDSSCNDTLTQTVTVEPGPVVEVNSATICAGEEVTLTATGADDFTWPDGETSSSITVSPSETTTYTVTGEENGCSSDTTATVTVSPLIEPTIDSTNVTCFGADDGTATVSTAVDSIPYTYTWNTTPEQTSSEATNLPAGEYTVYISDTIGCEDSATVTITEPTPLEISDTITHATCNEANGTATVEVNGGTAPYTYSWNTTPEQTTAEATTLGAGTYTATITDSSGCTDSTSVTIDATGAVDASVTTSHVQCNKGNDGTAIAEADGGTAPFTYSWNTTPEQTTAEITELEAGSYTVTITDSAGCKDTATATITEPSPIVIDTTVTQPTCSVNGEIIASVTGGTSPYAYLWDTSPAQTTATAEDLSAGTYTLKVTDDHDCRDSIEVTLNTPPFPAADFRYTPGCAGETANIFTDESTAPAQGTITGRTWDIESASGTITSTDRDPTHLFETHGTYNTTLTVTADNGCSDSLTRAIEVHPVPEVNFGPPKEGCSPVCIDFRDSSTVASGEITSWAWEFEDESGVHTSGEEAPSHCFEAEGTYDVSLRVTTGEGCSAALTRDDIVHAHPSPDVSLSDTTICSEEQDEGNMPTFNAGEGAEYTWYPSGEKEQKIKVSNPGSYSVEVTNEWGCVGEATANVEEACPPRVFVPTAFSPDGDGFNDVHEVQTAHVGDYQLLIFNRWGEIIFESRDPNHYWDGIYKNEPMPVGVYPWVVVYRGDSEQYDVEYRKEGSVTVVR